MDDFGHARLVDFGLATVTRSLDSMRSVSCQRDYTARWAAPEVLDEDNYSKEADIFAFAMVMIEVRHSDVLRVELWPTIASYQYRCSLALFRSAIVHLSGLC